MKKQMKIDNLNGDRTTKQSTITQYATDTIQALKDYRPELADFFLAGVDDEKQHVQFMETDRVLRDWPI